MGVPGPVTATALQLEVPDAQPLLDAVAAAGLPGVGLLPPPHVSLGYPWLAGEAAFAAVPALAEALAATPPVRLRFGAAARFGPDPRGRTVVHLVPDDEGGEAVRRIGVLASAIVDAPHLSVARVAADGPVERVEALIAPLLPLATTVDVVSFSARWGGDWRVERFLRLGTGLP